MLPKAIKEIIEEFSKLPGIGPKSAERLAFYLLRSEQRDLDSFSEAVENVKKGTVLCETCFNITEKSPCPICSNQNREKDVVCVVEEPLDVFAIEKTGEFRGVYHVLHGALSPIDNIGPDDIKLRELLARLQNSEIKELIIATNPNPKGEATAIYIAQKLGTKKGLKITHLAHGLPLGGEIEYADFETLGRALKGRVSY
jgi:recombination protein RecR